LDGAGANFSIQRESKTESLSLQFEFMSLKCQNKLQQNQGQISALSISRFNSRLPRRSCRKGLQVL